MSTDGNGDRGAKIFVVVDQHGDSIDLDYDAALLDLHNLFQSLPIGGRLIITRIQ